MYTHTTLAQFRAQLSAGLKDPTNLFWTTVELDSILAEALRTWQLLTRYWRERVVFDVDAGHIFYDLHTQFPSVLGMTVTTQSTISEMQRALLEPPTPAAWTGTDLFTLDDLTLTFQNRRNRFLLDTGAVVSWIALAATPVPAYREFLPDNVIDVIRAAWVSSTGVYRALRRTVDLLINLYSPRWTLTPSDPLMFSTLMTPPLTLQVLPPPLDVGTLELLIIQSPAAIDSTSPTDLISIPDNMSWVPKWGALADLLLRDGEPHDSLRGQYALMRYNHGIQLAAITSPIIQYELQGVTAVISTISEMDDYHPGWQNDPGEPNLLIQVGQNFIGFHPAPDGVYSVTLDLVRNAPIPTLDADYLQLSRGDLDIIIGYCKHLAMFKSGGAEFAATMPLFQSFLSQALSYNLRLSELDPLIRNYIQTVPGVIPAAGPIATSKSEGEDANA